MAKVDMDRKGTANLPLHYGKPPEYLFKRMVELGGIISDLIIQKFGVRKYLDNLADPFWFHSLSLATGFDWNSSGTTTATLSALKEYYSDHSRDVMILGGKGKRMSEISNELNRVVGDGILRDSEAERIKKTSRRIAKVDQDLLQDTFDLYMHFIIIDRKGNWVIVQQGMNQEIRMARRYHWINGSGLDLLNDGRNGISAEKRVEKPLNLSTKDSINNRGLMVELVRENPGSYRGRIARGPQRTLENFSGAEKSLDMNVRVNWKLLRSIYEYQPDGFEDLMHFHGVGKSAMRAVSYMAELIYGESPSYEDPIKYSFALGGKDGIPKPVNVGDYDLVTSFYREVLKDSGNRSYDRVLRNLGRYSYGRTMEWRQPSP